MGFETPPMPSPKETAEAECKNFNEVEEQEQIKRFLDVKSLFEDKEKSENKRADYFDFYNNIYKYTDKFKAEGMDNKQVADMFEEATNGNKIIKKTLDFFLETKKSQSGEKNNTEITRDALNKIVDECGHNFIDAKTGQLNSEKLTNLFQWSLKTFIKGGEKIGREPKVKEEEVKPMSEDLEFILKRVNNMNEGTKFNISQESLIEKQTEKSETLSEKNETNKASFENPKSININSGIKSFEKGTPIEEIITKRGSAYKYLPDGRTQRFKKVEGKYYEPQSALVFVPDFKWIQKNAPKEYIANNILGESNAQYNQILLEYVQGKGKTVWIIDEKGNKIETDQEIAKATEKGKIFLTFGQKTDEKKYKEDFRIPVTEQPTIGYNTFDTRKYKKGDQWMRERHLGNKVVEIIRK